MVPITLSDSVSFGALPSAGDGVRGAIELDVRECYAVRAGVRPAMTPAGDENLIVRALERLRERSGCTMGARVTLVKRIPAAAGLGGGSSDAAAALRLANSAWQLHWPVERLMEVAAEIGSDVPFFLHGGAAICRGRGEQVEGVRGMRPLHFVVAKPASGLSTADVYRTHDSLTTNLPLPRGFSQVDARGRRCFMQASSWMFNRLQAAAAAISPRVERLQAAFARLDFVAHQLSGSGSAYFGVCRHAQHARRLATILRTQQLGLVFATRSCA